MFGQLNATKTQALTEKAMKMGQVGDRSISPTARPPVLMALKATPVSSTSTRK